MPNTTITSLPAASSANASAVVAADNSSGTLTEKVTLGQIASLAGDDVRLRALAGVGNLREWFERQHNAFTNTPTAGKNKRVSICLFGDSLVQRMAGWLAYYASESYGYSGQSGGFGNLGGPVYTGGPNAPLGLFYQRTGDTTEVLNGFSIWPNGQYIDVGPGGTIYWPFVTGSTVDLWKIAYVSEPSAATFVVEIASATAGPWTQLGAEVNASNATQIGSIVSRNSGTFLRRFIRLRNTHATARVKVIDAYAGWATTVRGYDGLGISQGGISPSQAAQASPAIFTPIMASLDPGLIVVHFDDSLASYENNWSALMAFLRAGNANRSLLFVSNGPHANLTDADSEATLRFLLGKVRSDNIAVLDMMSLLSSYAAATQQGWVGDGVHLDERAYAYVANRAWNDLSIGTRASVTSGDRATFRERLSVPEVRLESRPGANLFSSGVVDDYYFRMIGDTSSVQGGRIETTRDFWVTNKGATDTLMILCTNDAVFGNKFPARLYRLNVASEVIPGGYTSITSGVLDWTFGNKRVLRDQSTGQVLRLGPFTGEASLDFPSIDAGGEQTLTVTVAGVTTAGKFAVSVGWSAAIEAGVVVKQARVSATNTVSITLANITTAPVNPAAVTAYVVATGMA